MNIIEAMNLITMTALNVAPNFLPLVVHNEADRLKAEFYLSLFRAGAMKLQTELVEVMKAIEDPSTIDLDVLVMDDFDAMVERLRPTPPPVDPPSEG